MLGAAGPAGAQDLAAEAAAVRDKALSDPTAWRIVESLTTEVGARPVGTAAMARARDWALAKLASLGFENVRAEPFTTKAWIRGEESAEVVAPAPQKLRILGLSGSAPTPKGGLTGEVALFPTYQAMLDQPAGALDGKIAVVTQAMTRTQDGSGYGAILAQRAHGATEAAKRGAIAYLVRSLSTMQTRAPHAGYADYAGIPAAALSPPDAEQLERLAALGKPVSLKLVMASTVDPAATAWNVVGEIRGRERPDELIVVGGHLDSWDPGTGATDDGAGVAITTAAARLATLHARPRRTIRVVLWGSEEQGGSGSAYAAAHAAEVGNVVLAGEADIGAERVWRVALPAAGRDHPAVKAFLAALAPFSVVVSPDPAVRGGADVDGLVQAGAPVVQVAQDASRYFDFHHSADDTLDKIDPKALAQATAVWASLLEVVANSDVDFRPRGASSP
ncbi:M20/M25/M40 family metallo-hydrolase [Phenylobacterium sp.]|uniref:M20/M25/M40 family metallo-hydrolase n=1 Tax=Phenylobacterium sp. TaxID=1871053 RepID=UPI002B46E04E|nr:M20/M25/M40 family metallo-hydrolase [Phenylobacterium sp.]